MSSQIDELYSDAQEKLNKNNFKDARELGHKLLKLRFSGAYEILAKSFHGEGQLPIAIQVLENGVTEAPQVWLLWLQLGNYRSEANDLTGALTAFEQARKLPGVDLEQVDFNEAFLRLRFGNPEKAIELFKHLRKARDPKIKMVALTHHLTTLIELERITEALMELGEAYLHESDNAALLSTLAFKLLEKKDTDNALNLAKQALGLKRSGEVARVLRLLEGQQSDHACLFEIDFEGTQTLQGSPHDFHKTSRVYADNEEEAQQLVLDFEPPDIKSQLQITAIRLLEPTIQAHKGVDWSSEPKPMLAD